jgi:hypothetical protein
LSFRRMFVGLFDHSPAPSRLNGVIRRKLRSRSAFRTSVPGRRSRPLSAVYGLSAGDGPERRTPHPYGSAPMRGLAAEAHGGHGWIFFRRMRWVKQSRTWSRRSPA